MNSNTDKLGFVEGVGHFSRSFMLSVSNGIPIIIFLISMIIIIINIIVIPFTNIIFIESKKYAMTRN